MLLQAGLILCFICCAIMCIGITDGDDDAADGEAEHIHSPDGDAGAHTDYTEVAQRV